MSRTARPIELLPRQRRVLERIGRRSSGAHRAVMRVRIILLADARLDNLSIAQQVGVDDHCVSKWRSRWSSQAEWLNVMGDWPRAHIEAILTKEVEAPMAKRVATERLLSADGQGDGAGRDFERCCERTYGRPPTAHVIVISDEEQHRTPEDMIRELEGLLGRNPGGNDQPEIVAASPAVESTNEA